MHEERRLRLTAAWSSDLGVPVVRLARAIAKQTAITVGRMRRGGTLANAERTSVEPEVA